MTILTFVPYVSLVSIVEMIRIFLSIPQGKNSNITFQTVFAMMILS